MLQTDTVISHPDVVFYDFYEAYDDPIPADAEKYLSKFGYTPIFTWC
jgi:cellobiose dehydrogenase (acceptor)